MKYILLILLLNIELMSFTNDSNQGVEKPVFESPYQYPLIFMGAGLALSIKNDFFDKYTIHDDIRSQITTNTKVDDYLLFTPVVLLASFDALDLKTKNGFKTQTVLLTESVMLSTTVVLALKYTAGVERPDKSNKFSFPSGHTSLAFTLATVMSKEMFDNSVYYSILSYSIASTVGLLRITNNKHYISDVLFGAGIGLASTYLVYDLNKDNSFEHWNIFPFYSQNGYGLSFSAEF